MKKIALVLAVVVALIATPFAAASSTAAASPITQAQTKITAATDAIVLALTEMDSDAADFTITFAVTLSNQFIPVVNALEAEDSAITNPALPETTRPILVLLTPTITQIAWLCGLSYEDALTPKLYVFWKSSLLSVLKNHYSPQIKTLMSRL